tara:strand:+ start:3015 stop:3272 length:258 start_codon:yes stop_codon:yes gene_type:complete
MDHDHNLLHVPGSDDWVVRIEYHDGTIIKKGVSPETPLEQAQGYAIRDANTDMFKRTGKHYAPTNVDIRRRWEWNTLIFKMEDAI